LIAAGNSADDSLVPAIQTHLSHQSPLVRGMAVWALGKLLAPAPFARLSNQHMTHEADEQVRAEWREALTC